MNNDQFNELAMCESLGMSIEEYRQHLIDEIQFMESKSHAEVIENKYHAEITYTLEKEFIDFNLNDLQYFLGIADIKPLGKYSSEILSDILYRGIPGISRDVVNEIMSNFKIINVRKVYDKFAERCDQNTDHIRADYNCVSCINGSDDDLDANPDTGDNGYTGA